MKFKKKTTVISEPTIAINKKCPNCGALLVKHTESEDLSSDEKNPVYRNEVWYKCDNCKFEVDLDMKVDLAKLEQRKELREKGFLTDLDIKRIRKKFKLTQEQMDKKLGIGDKSFARYESLRAHPGRAMDNLLRILDAYPDAINVLKGKVKDKRR